MHDGQNLFESQKSYIGVDWGLDETMAIFVRRRKFDRPLWSVSGTRRKDCVNTCRNGPFATISPNSRGAG
jgi:hypothetical protein